MLRADGAHGHHFSQRAMECWDENLQLLELLLRPFDVQPIAGLVNVGSKADSEAETEVEVEVEMAAGVQTQETIVNIAAPTPPSEDSEHVIMLSEGAPTTGWVWYRDVSSGGGGERRDSRATSEALGGQVTGEARRVRGDDEGRADQGAPEGGKIYNHWSQVLPSSIRAYASVHHVCGVCAGAGVRV